MPKVPGYDTDNEDSVAVGVGGLQVAISDGASESFDARRWSRVVADNFVAEPRFDNEWVTRTVQRYTAFLQALLAITGSWAVVSAAERGSFASLLGLQRLPANRGVRVTAVGDSVAVLLTKKACSRFALGASFPYSLSHEFRRRPQLLATNPALNAFCTESAFPMSHQTDWLLGVHSELTILCMTDALAEWAFRQQETNQPVWDTLAGMTDCRHFEQLVTGAREKKVMRHDDSTLVVVTCPFLYSFGDY